MSIGTALGTVAGFVTGVPYLRHIGAAFDAYQGAKSSNAAQMNQFVRLRQAAERAGFHPLEVLRAGGQVGWQSPRLASSAAMTNAFDMIEDELTGEAAKRAKRQQVEDEIRQRELEILQQQTAAVNSVITRPSIATGAVLGGDNQLEVGRETVSNPLPRGGEGEFTSPWNPDAEVAEARWGDVMQEVVGIGNIFKDMSYNAALGRLAKALGVSKRELHERIANAPDPKAEFAKVWSEALNRPQDSGGPRTRPQIMTPGLGDNLRDYTGPEPWRNDPNHPLYEKFNSKVSQ